MKNRECIGIAFIKSKTAHWISGDSKLVIFSCYLVTIWVKETHCDCKRESTHTLSRHWITKRWSNLFVYCSPKVKDHTDTNPQTQEHDKALIFWVVEMWASSSTGPSLLKKPKRNNFFFLLLWGYFNKNDILKTEISFFYIVFTSLKVMQQLTSKKQKEK